MGQRKWLWLWILGVPGVGLCGVDTIRRKLGNIQKKWLLLLGPSGNGGSNVSEDFSL